MVRAPRELAYKDASQLFQALNKLAFAPESGIPNKRRWWLVGQSGRPSVRLAGGASLRLLRSPVPKDHPKQHLRTL